MARPNIENDPRFIMAKAALAPLKSRVDNAKREAEEMVRNARIETEQEMLNIVKSALESGLSRYAVGRLTGKTSNKDQIKLVERAMREGR